MRTMWEALKLCLPITIMTFAIFVRSNIVVNPGWNQIADVMLVAIACCGISFSIFGKFASSGGLNGMLRALLALASFTILFHPDEHMALMFAAMVLPATIYGVARHRRIAPPVDEQPSA